MIFDEEDERSRSLHFGGMNLNLNSQNSPSSEHIGELNWQIFWTECHQMNHPILAILKYLKSTYNLAEPLHFQLEGFPHPTLNANQPYLCYYIFSRKNSNPGCEGFLHLNFSGKALNTHRPTWNILSFWVLGGLKMHPQESVRVFVWPCSTKPPHTWRIHPPLKKWFSLQ